MKIRVFGNEVKLEKEVTLRLVDYGGRAVLIAVDKRGEPVRCGYLLTVDERGVHLHSSVDPELGFPLEHFGHLKIDRNP